MTELKSKVLSYRRAVWFVDAHLNNDLGQLLAQCLAKRSEISDTRFESGSRRVDVRSRVVVGNECHLHISSYAVGEHASIVKQDHVAGNEDLGTAPPPQDADYLDNDAYLLIRGSDVFICPNGMTEKSIAGYLRFLIGLEHSGGSNNFSVERVSAKDKVQQLLNEGVKSIDLNITDYAAEIDAINEAEASPVRKLMSAARAMVQRDQTERDARAYGLVQSKVVYTFDGRIAGIEAEQILSDMAFDIVDEVEEGFVIRTKEGSEITANDISIRKNCRIERDGKSLKRDAAWSALEEFAAELKANGIC